MRSCWQIRQEITNKGGEGKPNGWLVQCTECAMYLGDQSCWEQCKGSPCCCAPMHVTCDFCILYIEHRREIAEMLQASQGRAETPDMAVPLPTVTPQPIPIKGEMSATMEKLQFNIPGMWADHHVLKVRAILTSMAGVQDVVASSAFRMVALSYDPATVTPDQIAAALASAGYPISTNGTDVVAETVPVAAGKRDPAWYRLGLRQHKTDERDLKTKR